MTFGRTWWGNAWVEAMERVDRDTNRLPRGRRYARNGSVLEIRLEKGSVRALVQGTRPKPYKVGFRLKPFTPSETSKTRLLVASNPAIAAELSLGRLPRSMLDMLEGAGISLLPRSWEELEARCSCPDWANPCKHLAAVYYIVANEIDKDPFIAFNLRGVTAAALRGAAGMLAADEEGEAMWEEMAFIPHGEAEAAPAPPEWLDLDLSFPRLDLEGVFSLLQDAPLFWEDGDFKKVLRGAYTTVAAEAESPEIIEEFPPLRTADFYLVLDGARPTFFIALDRENSPGPKRLARMISAATPEACDPRPARRILPVASGSGLRLSPRRGVRLDADPVLDLFLALPVETDLARYSPSSRALCVAGAIALSLARSSSFVPEVIPVIGTRENPGTFPEVTPVTGTRKTSRTFPEVTPGTGTGKAPDDGTGKTLRTGTRKTSRTFPEVTPGTGTGKAPDDGTRETPGTFPEVTPGTFSEVTPVTGTDTRKTPGTDTRKTPGTGTDTNKTPDTGAGAFRVRYLPLVQDESVRRALGTLESLIPANLAYRRKGKAVPAPGSARHLVALFLDRIVRRFSGMPENLATDKLARAFFRGQSYQPGRFEEGRTAVSVANWLERLYIRGKAVSPVIRIEVPDEDVFGLHLDVEDRDDPLAPILSLAEVFAAEGEVFSRPARRVKRDLARQIAIAGEYIPQLHDILNSRGVMSAVIGPEEMAGLLARHSTLLGILGIRLVLPRELARLLTPSLTMRATTKGGGKAVTYLSLREMLRFDWEISLGDTVISREDFTELARSAEGVVRFKDGYLLLSPGEARRLLEKMSKPPPVPSPLEFLHWALAGEMDGVALRPDRALAAWLKKLARADTVRTPASLQGDLRPYQERGLGWLYTNAVRGLGSCLADDMGLGKTVQAIALVLKLKEGKEGKGGKEGKEGKRPALVVCPTTVAGNWHKELEKFAPSLRASIYHGTDRRLSTRSADLVITTYGILRRDLEKFKARRWGVLIVDEAQNIKNPRTDQARAVKALKADVRIALSGTPVENHLGELWSIFDFLNPGYLGSLESFHKGYAAPIEKYRDAERIERLKRVTAPFIMRRLKSDKKVISDLPDKITAEEYCYLTGEQAALYQRVVEDAMRIIECSEGMQRRGLILKLITSLKQVCNHPVLFAKKGRAQARLSGKAARAVSLLANTLAAGEKTLVFTQYVEMGEILLRMFEAELGERALFFHGGIPRRKRDELVREFQEGGDHAIMVVSLKAGGTGLNLTAASNVIHYDLWWNPAVEEQATDRTYRIGQERNVCVHRLITLNTFEERIDEMMRDKRELAELTVSAGEKWITELSDRELKEMFALRPLRPFRGQPSKVP